MSEDNRRCLYVSEETETPEMQDLEIKVYELEISCRQLREINNKVDCNVTILESLNKRNRVEIQWLRKHIHKVESSCDRHKTLIKQIRVNKNYMSQENLSLREKLAQRDKELEKKTLENNSYIKVLEVKVTELEGDIASNARLISQLEDKKKSLLQENASLSGKLALHDKELEDLQSQFESSSEKLASCESLNKRIQRENEALREQSAKTEAMQRQEIQFLKRGMRALQCRIEKETTGNGYVPDGKVKGHSERHKKDVGVVKFLEVSRVFARDIEQVDSSEDEWSLPESPSAGGQIRGFLRTFGRRLLGAIRTGVHVGKTAVVLLIPLAIMATAEALRTSSNDNFPSFMRDLYYYMQGWE